jgi:hypothetical protein
MTIRLRVRLWFAHIICPLFQPWNREKECVVKHKIAHLRAEPT